MSDARAPRAEIPSSIFWRNFCVCILGAPLIVIVPLVITGLINYLATHPALPQSGSYIASLICLVPFLQALSFGIACGRYRVGRRYVGVAGAIFGIDLLIAMLALGEGVICVIIASPILLAIIAIGMGIGVAVGNAIRSPVMRSSFVPLALLVATYDSQTGPPIYATSVADTMTINAPPEYVWRYIASYPENDAPADYWLWRIGLPLPTRSVATAAEIGATRECRFSNGIVLNEKITELVPNKVMTFDITEQPKDPEILGHLALDKGQLYLEPNADGSTTVIATSWYRLFVAPAVYFDWWATDIARNIHRRVLSQVKRLAEADWLREHPEKSPKTSGS
jgi:uncharacterized protein YndB with AHSA1/START domain